MKNQRTMRDNDRGTPGTPGTPDTPDTPGTPDTPDTHDDHSEGDSLLARVLREAQATRLACDAEIVPIDVNAARISADLAATAFAREVAAWCARTWHQYLPRAEALPQLLRWQAAGIGVALAYFAPPPSSGSPAAGRTTTTTSDAGGGWRYRPGRSGTLLSVETPSATVPYAYVRLRRYDGRASRVRADRWHWLFKLLPAQALTRELATRRAAAAHRDRSHNPSD